MNVFENNMDYNRVTEEVPEKYRVVFSNFKNFNKIQSKVFDDVFYTDKPIVVSSPTGSGKTVIFELAIIRFLINLEANNTMRNSKKIIYISPMKALCEERLLDWHNKFNCLGLNCVSVTGDNENYDLYNLNNYSLIITTPEKWDSLTRRWKNNKPLMQSIKLFMIDEVHLLNEEGRGSTLEAVLNRMKIIEDTVKYDYSVTNQFQPIRFMAVSATIPNVEDIAEWLGNSLQPAKSFKFGEDLRPVPLKTLVFGYTQQSNLFKFDMSLNYRLQSIIVQHSGGRPTLIFCNTRKSVEMTTKHLMQCVTVHLSDVQKTHIQNSSSAIPDQSVRTALMSGIGFHHAGLPLETRRVIEDLFRNGNLGVLVTTSTLAIGVNLPAHLVIVKTTKYYGNGECRDYSESMILQMIGRAGRPQFDTSGTAVILTSTIDKPKYEKLVEGQQAIESSLHKHLTEHLNAEVVLQTITDLSIAIQWIASTFLYVRARKNPKHYGFPMGLSPDQIDRKLMDMCQIEINKLAKTGLLIIDQNDTGISPTLAGSLMAKYYIAFDTMKLFTQISGKENMQQVLSIISKCREFSEIYLRTDEKKALNLLNISKRECIRFPLNGKIKTSDMKINCIIQAVFGCLPIVDYSLTNDSQKIMRIGQRISKCLAEYLETKENGYSALLSALIIAKCFHSQLWENSKFVSRQLPGIGIVLSSQLAFAGKTTFKSILEANPRDLERIMNRKPPFGNTIQEKVRHLPVYDLLVNKSEISDRELLIIVEVVLRNVDDIKVSSTVNLNSFMNLLVGDPTENVIYLYEKYVHSNFLIEPTLKKEIRLTDYDEIDAINVNFISEDWVGFDQSITLQLRQPSTKRIKDSVKEKSEIKVSQAKKVPEKKRIQALMDRYFKNAKKTKTSTTLKKKKSFSGTLERKNINAPKDILTKNETDINTTKNILSKNEIPSSNLPLQNKEADSKNNNDSSFDEYFPPISSKKETTETEISINKNYDNHNSLEEFSKQKSSFGSISPNTLKKSMEQYVKDNIDCYDKYVEKYVNPTSENDKKILKLNDKNSEGDININKDKNTKPSLSRKLSGINLAEEENFGTSNIRKQSSNRNVSYEKKNVNFPSNLMNSLSENVTDNFGISSIRKQPADRNTSYEKKNVDFPSNLMNSLSENVTDNFGISNISKQPANRNTSYEKKNVDFPPNVMNPLTENVIDNFGISNIGKQLSDRNTSYEKTNVGFSSNVMNPILENMTNPPQTDNLILRNGDEISSPLYISPQNLSLFNIKCSPKIYSQTRKLCKMKKSIPKKVINMSTFRFRTSKPDMSTSYSQFENRLYDSIKSSECQAEQSHLKEFLNDFSIEPKEKLSNQKKPEDFTGSVEVESNAKMERKTLTWRSPLVISPQRKYSPNYHFGLSRNVNNNECPAKNQPEPQKFYPEEESRDFYKIPRKEVIDKFPVSDIAFRRSQIHDETPKDSWESESLKDFVSESLLETIRAMKRKQDTIKSKGNKSFDSDNLGDISSKTVASSNWQNKSPNFNPNSSSNYDLSDLTFSEFQTNQNFSFESNNSCKTERNYPCQPTVSKQTFPDQDRVPLNPTIQRNYPQNFQEDNFSPQKQYLLPSSPQYYLPNYPYQKDIHYQRQPLRNKDFIETVYPNESCYSQQSNRYNLDNSEYYRKFQPTETYIPNQFGPSRKPYPGEFQVRFDPSFEENRIGYENIGNRRYLYPDERNVLDSSRFRIDQTRFRSLEPEDIPEKRHIYRHDIIPEQTESVSNFPHSATIPFEGAINRHKTFSNRENFDDSEYIRKKDYEFGNDVHRSSGNKYPYFPVSTEKNVDFRERYFEGNNFPRSQENFEFNGNHVNRSQTFFPDPVNFPPLRSGNPDFNYSHKSNEHDSEYEYQFKNLQFPMESSSKRFR